jgi:ketosteroid isomerase-like protein
MVLMRTVKYLSVILILVLLFSCTKEVPESNKKTAKSTEEVSVASTINGFIDAYNQNDLTLAASFLDTDYKGIVADSDDTINAGSTLNELKEYHKQYPEGKWEIKIEEIYVGSEFAYVMTKSSFMTPGPPIGNINSIYSERSIRILKKQKDDGWKIFRYIATPTFSYDAN